MTRNPKKNIKYFEFNHSNLIFRIYYILLFILRFVEFRLRGNISNLGIYFSLKKPFNLIIDQL